MEAEAYRIGIPVRVLITQKEDHAVAHSLEIDQVGVGPNVGAALDKLRHAIFCQLSLCAHVGNLENFLRPAPKEAEERYFAAQQGAVMRGDGCSDASFSMEFAATFIITPEEVQEAKQASDKFEEAEV